MTSITRSRRQPFRMTRVRRKTLKVLLLLLPFLVFIFIFSYLPLFGWSYAFMEYNPGLSFFDQKFVGLKHFEIIFSGGSNMAIVMRNTLMLSFLSILCSVVSPTFAILLSQLRSRKYTRLVQSVTSIPNFISWVLVYSIVFAFFSTNDGAINQLLITFGLIDTPFEVLGNTKIAWYFQTAVNLWKGTGWGAIIYMATITGLDQELFDAADVDGANRFQKILHITIPGILTTYLVLFLMGIANILSNGFEHYWVFQNALTMDRLEVFDTYVYRLGMVNMKYSFSTAMGILKSVVSITLLTIANYLSKLIRGDSIF